MKKSEQLAINEQVLNALTVFNCANVSTRTDLWKPLRSCSAEVAPAIDNETGEVLYYVLRSYRTIVAIIDIKTDTLYDFLRYVYGYTSTSAQHISKFSKDYGMGKWGCAHSLTYRDI